MDEEIDLESASEDEEKAKDEDEDAEEEEEIDYEMSEGDRDVSPPPKVTKPAPSIPKAPPTVVQSTLDEDSVTGMPRSQIICPKLNRSIQSLNPTQSQSLRPLNVKLL